jgi:GDP-D-mannose dehydratase
MRSATVDHNLAKLQQDMYGLFNAVSQDNNVLGRVFAIPVAAVDVALETFKAPLRTIEAVAMAAINLLGATRFSSCTVRHALFYAQTSFNYALSVPVAVLMAPILFVYQSCVALWDPENIKSISLYPTVSNPYGWKIFV